MGALPSNWCGEGRARKGGGVGRRDGGEGLRWNGVRAEGEGQEGVDRVGRSVSWSSWLVGRSLARRPPLYTYHSFLEMTEPSVCEIMSSAISCSGSYWKARVRSSYSRLSPSSTVK